MAALVVHADVNRLRQEIISTFKSGGKTRDPKIVFVSGNFNIIHPGHQRLIQFAADCGDILVVGINPDRIEGVMFPQSIRVDGIKELSLVNYVVPIVGELAEVLNNLKPEIVVKGKEHENMENPELPILEGYGGRLLFSSGDAKFSSLNLLRQDFENIQYSTIQLPRDYLHRHKLTGAALIQAVQRLKGLKVLVIGDTIVDEYVTCEPLGLSQEDPTIVVNPIHRKKFVGGAAIVAAHASGLGGDVRFFSVVGRDENAEFVAEHLKKYGVNHNLLEDIERPTTLKQRYRTKEKTLLRVNELRQHSISNSLIDQMIARIRPAVEWCDLLVFSDFNYGCLPNRLVQELTQWGLKREVVMVADSQSSSQMGDVSRFKDMKLLTPTEREARLALGDFESGLVVLSDELMRESKAQNVYIKLGSEGMLIRATVKKRNTLELVTEKLPAFNFAPKDTAGAGDSLLICSSMLLATGENPWVCAYIGSLAAAIQVSRVGNTPLTSEDLLTELRSAQITAGAVS